MERHKVLGVVGYQIFIDMVPLDIIRNTVGRFRQLHPTIINVAKLQRKLCAVMQHGAFFSLGRQNRRVSMKNQTKEKESLKNQRKEIKPITAEEVAKRIPGLKVGKLPKD